LTHELLVLADNIAHPGIVDLLKTAYVLKGLDKGGSEAAHVTYHDLDTGPISRFDDRLSLLAGQAHRFLNENMLPLANGSEGRIGRILMASQCEFLVLSS